MIRPPASADTATNVVEVPVSTTIIPPPDLKISNFEKMKYRSEVLNADHFTQAASRTHSNHVEKVCTVVRVSSWVNGLGSFSVAKKNTPSDCFSVCVSAVNGKLEVPLYLFDGFHRRAMSRTINDSRMVGASFCKGAFV